MYWVLVTIINIYKLCNLWFCISLYIWMDVMLRREFINSTDSEEENMGNGAASSEDRCLLHCCVGSPSNADLCWPRHLHLPKTRKHLLTPTLPSTSRADYIGTIILILFYFLVSGIDTSHDTNTMTHHDLFVQEFM